MDSEALVQVSSQSDTWNAEPPATPAVDTEIVLHDSSGASLFDSALLSAKEHFKRVETWAKQHMLEPLGKRAKEVLEQLAEAAAPPLACLTVAFESTAVAAAGVKGTLDETLEPTLAAVGQFAAEKSAELKPRVEWLGTQLSTTGVVVATLTLKPTEHARALPTALRRCC